MDDRATQRQWTDVVRRARLGRTVKAVALAVGSYADSDGSRVFPGIARLAWECELHHETAQDALRDLRNLGLIRKVGRRGEADEYCLTLHEDLLNRLDVPTPAQARAAIEKIRKAMRGKHKPKLPGSGTVAAIDGDDGLPGSATQAQASDDEDLPGSATPADSDLPGWAIPPLPGSPTPATYQDHITTTTSHSDEGVRADLAVVGPSGRETDQKLDEEKPKRGPCPHGRSSKRRRDGQPRCDACRADTDRVSDPQLVRLGPAHCTQHGKSFQAGNRPDGQPRCPLCRALEARAA